MSALDRYRSMLRDIVGPALREAGMRGSRGRWWLRSPLGDHGIVELRTSTASSRDEVEFSAVLAVAPEPWLADRAARGVVMPRTGPRAEDGLWREVLGPESAMLARFRAADPSWWAFPDDPYAEGVGPTLADLLVEVAVPRIEELLDRRQLVTELRLRKLADWERIVAMLGVPVT
ncbi:hypothetical protein GCM10010123_30510 [Pilimelia anulata]|uniref:Uncharacterized protein n=1 Tax=Pilimelia anulata TaxID=53371 RepID=A0A8J3B685_9ACTN|nr:hypothetical protein [Pilimelia anulata]GGJ98424.1 hypothetical protein GCM10010123_30510 [Pilimelia anulata]